MARALGGGCRLARAGLLNAGGGCATGGVRMIDALGYNSIRMYHMNEGHAALLTLQLLKNEMGEIDSVQEECVFTTHTPVAAGHDKFPRQLVEQTLRGFITNEEATSI